MDWFLPHPRSRLLALPSELRDLIFQYALTSATTVVTFRLDPYQEDSYSQAVQPALTRVNRQVRHEALPVWYRRNAFILHTEAIKADHTIRWLGCNEPHLPLLRTVEVWIRVLGTTNMRSVASGAVGLALKRTGRETRWSVQEEWRWITVCRRPEGIEEDVVVLQQWLEGARNVASAQDWGELLKVLKEEYTKTKTE